MTRRHRNWPWFDWRGGARAYWPQLCLMGLMALIFVGGSPFYYDQGNGGRYLVGVLRDLDPGLFPDDAVADGLALFRSLFYDGLGFGLRLAGVGPAGLPATMTVLYGLSRIALVIVLGALLLSLTKKPWPLLLFLAWAAGMRTAPLGGGQLFAATLRHTEVAVLLLLPALVAGLHRHFVWFWLLIALALFVHPLVALHFAIGLAPALFIWLWRRDRPAVHLFLLIGLLFVAAALAYQLLLAPPAFSPADAAIFWDSKGSINHVSLAGVTASRWLDLVSLLALTVTVYWQLRPSPPAGLLLVWTLTGAGTALILSVVATAGQVLFLGLLQPLRIFVWVNFAAYLLLALGAGSGWRRRDGHGWLRLFLAVYIFLSIVESEWRMIIALAVVALIIVHQWRGRRTPVPVSWLPPAAATLLTAAAILLLATGRRPFGIETSPAALLLLVALVLAAIPRRPVAWHSPLLLLLLFAISLTFQSLAAYTAYERQVDPDWHEVMLWAREHSTVDARFLISNAGDTFRVRALRTAAPYNHGALAWVDPVQFQIQHEQALQIQSGWKDGAWDVLHLTALARSGASDYVIVIGPFFGPTPLFRQGDYAVFAVAP